MGNQAHLMVAGEGTANRLKTGLASGKFHIETVPADQTLIPLAARHRPNVLILDGMQPNAPEILQSMKADATTRYIPVAVTVATGSTDRLRVLCDAGADDVFETGADPREFLARLRSLVRLSSIEAELVRRAATARDFGVTVETEATMRLPEQGFRMLVVGVDTKGFSALCPNLPRSDIQFVAEADPYRARSRIENPDGEPPFDGALVFVRPGEAREKALYFCHAIRNDRRLFDLPLFVAAETGAFAEITDAYAEGANVVAATPVDCGFVEAHLRLLFRGRALKQSFGRRLADALDKKTADESGKIYSTEFLAAHLRRIIQDGKARGIGSTALLLFVPTIGEAAALYGTESSVVLRQQIADWLGGLVRVEDIVARSGNDEFLIVLPETAEADADAVRRRITGVLHQSEFRLSENLPTGVNVYVQSGMTTIEPADTLDTLVSRASAKLG